jgi:hypothetical protein
MAKTSSMTAAHATKKPTKKKTVAKRSTKKVASAPAA